MLVTDYGKAERPAVLHRAWQALHAFVRTHGRNPRPRHQVGGDGGRWGGWGGKGGGGQWGAMGGWGVMGGSGG